MIDAQNKMPAPARRRRDDRARTLDRMAPRTRRSANGGARQARHELTDGDGARGRDGARRTRAAVARALIVGCGCRGRMLGGALAAARMAGARHHPAAGGTRGDRGGRHRGRRWPTRRRVGTVLEQIEGVSMVFWLLGAAAGERRERRGGQRRRGSSGCSRSSSTRRSAASSTRAGAPAEPKLWQRRARSSQRGGASAGGSRSRSSRRPHDAWERMAAGDGRSAGERALCGRGAGYWSGAGGIGVGAFGLGRDHGASVPLCPAPCRARRRGG